MPSLLAATLDLVLPRHCVGCAAPAELLCARCRAAAGQVRRRRIGPVTVHAAAAYEATVQRMLIAFKERGRRDLAGPLAGLLAEALAASAAPIVVAVPTSRAARRRRGGDLLALVARRAVRLRGRQFSSALRLDRPVLDSVGLHADERRRNLAGAMVARPPLVAGQRCVIVDDIVTTGATVAEAYRALSAAGWRPTEAAVIATVELGAPP